MTKKIRRKRKRRRKREPKKALMVQESIKEKKTHARAALVARLRGGAFREFLVQKIPNYKCLESKNLHQNIFDLEIFS